MKELTGEQILSKYTDIDTLLTYMRNGLSAMLGMIFLCNKKGTHDTT